MTATDERRRFASAWITVLELYGDKKALIKNPKSADDKVPY